MNHRCIRFRHRGESVYKWELDKGDESLAIAVHGSLILDELDLVMTCLDSSDQGGEFAAQSGQSAQEGVP